MRKGFDGLYGLVRDRLLCEPLSGHFFLFCNTRRNRLKILVWSGMGAGCGYAGNDWRRGNFAGRRLAAIRTKCN